MSFPVGASPAAPVALLPWGDVIEDFLDPLDVSLDGFCREMTGGWLFGYVEALKRAGLRTVVFCVSARVEEPVRRTHEGTGATVCFLPAPKAYDFLRPVLERCGTEGGLLDLMGSYLATPIRELARELQREGCKTLLCQEYEYARFDVCVALGKLLGIPTYGTFQGGGPAGRLEGGARRLSVKHCAGLIVASQTELDRVRAVYEVPAHQLARIFNPLDLTEWTPVPQRQARTALGLSEAACMVVWHGRVDVHRKGLDVLLEAWQQVQRTRAEDVRLVLVGTGSDAEELRRRLAALPPSSGVTWIDEYILDRPTIRRYLSAADVYVLASRNEGLPVAPIEAMACGLPVVATDAPGVPDIFEAGERAGGIVVPREAPAALARALERMIEDEEERQQMGVRARRRVEEHFSLEAVGQQLRCFLSEHRLSECRAPRTAATWRTE